MKFPHIHILLLVTHYFQTSPFPMAIGLNSENSADYTIISHVSRLILMNQHNHPLIRISVILELMRHECRPCLRF